MKILITSVGSLVGQNLLDLLETRRDLVEIIGLNSVSTNPRNFRCDKVYFVNETGKPQYAAQFEEIIDKEKPDFIFPGRDEDCIFLADIRNRMPEKFANTILMGTPEIARMMMDKHASWVFCQENDISFADSFLYTDQADQAALNQFVQNKGFPLVVKPRKGFGSNGVLFLFHMEQLNEIIKSGDVLFQEYLGDSADILKYQDYFKYGIPLFFQVPEENQFAAQTILSRDGTLSDIFISKNTMVQGRAELIQRIQNNEIETIVKKVSKKLYQNGWFGLINVQLKQDKSGKWKIFEFNPRFTGTSSARLLLGFDEFGLLLRQLAPECNFPVLCIPDRENDFIFKYLTDNVLRKEQVDSLVTQKQWKRY